MGRTPRELLDSLDSDEIAELFAYHAIVADAENAQIEQRKLDNFVQQIGVAPNA